MKLNRMNVYRNEAISRSFLALDVDEQTTLNVSGMNIHISD